MSDILLNILNTLSIPHITYHHEPVFTVEQALQLASTIPGASCKNLFLKDSKNRFYLVVAVHDTVINLKKLSKYVHAPELRFANADLLKHYLGVEPGSVTPFGLIHDQDHAVTVFLDSNLFTHADVGFHPLINNATTVISSENLKKFIAACGNTYAIINFSEI
jgi:Ala-tRNA(Pro) deacylase